MHIGPASLVDRGDTVAVVANVTCQGRTYPLWFSVAASWARHLDPTCLDPFVLGALPLALRLGDPVYAAGRMSARLLFSLNTALPALVTQTGGNFQPIKVRAAQAVDYAPPPPYSRGVATGFSGGVDSFCVLCDHLGPAVPPAHRLTHLFANNVGAFGRHGTTTYRAQLPRLENCARELHLPLVAIDSNLEALLDVATFTFDHEFRNVAAALVLQSLVGTYLYASGFHYEECFRRGGDTPLASWDPVLLPLLSTERLRVLSVGAQYTRVDKTARIADFAPSRRYLQVCVRPGSVGNCSTCWKCARTQLALEVLGRLDEFGEVFDLALYRRIRPHYVVEMLRSDEPLWVEIRQLARTRQFEFPLTLRLAAALPEKFVGAVRRRLPSRLKHQLAT